MKMITLLAHTWPQLDNWSSNVSCRTQEPSVSFGRSSQPSMVLNANWGRPLRIYSSDIRATAVDKRHQLLQWHSSGFKHGGLKRSLFLYFFSLYSSLWLSMAWNQYACNFTPTGTISVVPSCLSRNTDLSFSGRRRTSEVLFSLTDLFDSRHSVL